MGIHILHISAITVLGLFSLAAILCFLVYVGKASSGARDDWVVLLKSYLKASVSQEKVPISEESLSKGTDDFQNFLRSVTSFQGTVIGLLSLITLHVIYYVHFK